MRILTSLLTAFLCFILAVSATSASTHSFSDVSTSHSNYKDIYYLLEHNIIESTDRFGVNEIVTREEVAVMVAKAVGLDGTPKATKFSDVLESNPNSGYIQAAVEQGIIKGYNDDTFKPNAQVTRGHMATFIARAFDLPNGTKTFKDVPKGSTAFEAAQQLAAASITTGYTDGTFKPDKSLTRAHIAAFLARAHQYQALHHYELFDVSAFIKVLDQLTLEQQLELMTPQFKSSTDQLAIQQRTYDQLLADKEQLEKNIATIQETLNAVQAEVSKHQRIISVSNQEIRDYRNNNKHMLTSSAQQKKKYKSHLESLQQQYAVVQQTTTKLLAERTTINNEYSKLKDELNRLRYAIKIHSERLAKEKTIVQQLKNKFNAIEWLLYQQQLKEDMNQQPKPIEPKPTVPDQEQKPIIPNDDTKPTQPIPNTPEPAYDSNLETLTTNEKELARLINEYRVSKGLAPLQISKSLTVVARTHVIDSNKYKPENGVDARGVKCNLHSWSTNGSWSPVCYTSDHTYAQNMWDKPRELTSYTGNGYEISVMSTYNLTPHSALKAWQGSSGHNDVIIGAGYWANLTHMGVGIYGNYSHVWFGEVADPAGEIK